MFQKYQFDPIIATALKSADKAFIIEYIAWSIRDREQKGINEFMTHSFHCGEHYMFDKYEAWQIRMPWLSMRTIRRNLESLKDDGWIKTAYLHPDPRNRILYYTIDWLKYHRHGQSGQLHVDKLDTCHVDKLDTCSLLTKTHTKTHNIYRDDHQFAMVFTNLKKLSIVTAKFKLDDYEKYLITHMEKNSLSIKELETLSHEWQEYHNDRSGKPKSPKGSFNTWISNYTKRRAENAERKLKWNQPRSINNNQFSSDDLAWDDYSAENKKYSEEF